MSTGNFPGIVSQQILVGMILVGRSGVHVDQASLSGAAQEPPTASRGRRPRKTSLKCSGMSFVSILVLLLSLPLFLSLSLSIHIIYIYIYRHSYNYYYTITELGVSLVLLL